MRISSQIGFAATLFLFSTMASGQVKINEFSAANYTLNIGGNNEDFLELYNPTGAVVDISGYFLSDKPNNPTKFEIPAGTTVPANGYRVIMCSGDGTLPGSLYAGGFLNTNFKVTQCDEESIVFSDPSGNILESYTFGTDWSTNKADQSWGRVPDGTGDWVVCATPTPVGANGGTTYSSYAAMPTFDLPAGYSAGPVNVAISAAPGMEIYYTLDGYAPSAASTLYTGPITVNQTTVIRAIAVDPTGDLESSLIETNTYFIGDDNHSIIVVSATGDQVEDGVWPWGTDDELMHLEFFHPDGTFWCEASGDSNEHGNDSNAYPQKGWDYITRDQIGHSYALEAELFHVKNRDKYQRLIFKAAANDNYPSSGGGHIRDAYVQTLSHLADLHVDERTNESCIVYLNGEYWGVYEYREKVDDSDFTNEYYDQGRYDVDFIKTWGGTWTEYGSNADWAPLQTFVTTQDMTDPANYDYVTSELNEMSMIDYVLLNSFVVCADWLNWNTAWWRGRNPDGDGRRWRYALWDMDNTFGHGANYTGVPSQNPDADPCNPESLGDPGGQGHIPMFNALLTNETFWATYINRWADLSNTHFSCDNMIAVLDSMIAVIDPEMERHVERWGGTYADWESNVQEIRDFIEARCAATVIGGLEDCYDVEAVNLTVIIEGLGEVEINSLDIGPGDSPLNATYFAGVPMIFTAEEDLGQMFLFWEVLDGDITLADPTNPILEFELTGDATIVAHFAANVDPEQVTFIVDPAGAGTIFVDGAPLTDAMATEILDFGGHTIEAVGVDEWHVFTGWTTTGLNVNPNSSSALASISVNQQDTITAHFDIIQHIDLVVRVEPPGKGRVVLEDGTVVSDYWEGGLEPIGAVDASATAEPYWAFSHWEASGTNPIPGPQSPEAAFPINESDTLVAYFERIEFAVYIPSAFSPNNDGVNDAFLPVGEAWDPLQYELIVFDRWGEVIFQTTDPNKPWIGESEHDTHFVRDGIYSYLLKVQNVHEEFPRSYTGNVQVIR